MKEIYRNPTIRRLAAARSPSRRRPRRRPRSRPRRPLRLPSEAGPRAQNLAGRTLRSASGAERARIPLPRRRRFGSRHQLGLSRFGLRRGLRAVGSGHLGEFLGVCLLPILAKWVLVGRWTSQRIRIWSLGYVRFWLVKTLIRMNPWSSSPARPSTCSTCGRWARGSAGAP